MTKHSENTKPDTCDNAVLANRLLEFNLWDIDRQQYFTDVLTLKRDAICKWATLEKRTSNNIIWLQFTGFFDKNGTKLFEGDIIKRVVKASKLLPAKIYFEVIRFEDASFKTFDLKKENDMGDVLADYSFHKIEKLGNVFQNPEFLQTTS